MINAILLDDENKIHFHTDSIYITKLFFLSSTNKIQNLFFSQTCLIFSWAIFFLNIWFFKKVFLLCHADTKGILYHVPLNLNPIRTEPSPSLQEWWIVLGIQIRKVKMVFNIYGTWCPVMFEKLMMKIYDFFIWLSCLVTPYNIE